MNGGRQPRTWHTGRGWALCLLLSLLLHLALALLLGLLPRSAKRVGVGVPRASRAVQVIRSAPKQEPESTLEEAPEKLPVVKTSADEAQQRPERPDFVGRHDQVASADKDAPQHRSDEPLPSMAGRESDELVTFDQERQDGALEHDHEAGAQAATTPPQPAGDTIPTPEPQQTAAQGRPDGSPAPAAEPQGEGDATSTPPSEGTASLTPHSADPSGELKLEDLHTQEAITLHPQATPAPLGDPMGTQGDAGTPKPHPRRPVYDPSLPAEAQAPGLRTYERRTRSTGRFVFGSRPAVNVSADERGRYEMEIYRRIARQWYAACDEHRGDIIPGSITVSLRLRRTGGIDSMDLVRRTGASVTQQSFSFGAIRRAALPPMPAEVQAEVIGELYEMILTFHFD